MIILAQFRFPFNHMKRLALICSFVILSLPAFAQRQHPSKPTVTGAPLIYEQSSYDVHSYDISIKVDVAAKSISGKTIMAAKIVMPTNRIMLDLDTPYTVTRVAEPYGMDTATRDLKWERGDGKIWISYPATKQPGDVISVEVEYAGEPRVAPNPPWVGGFMWKKTPNGADWVSVAMQNDGADLLFPVKDHPSDKASEVAMQITVPEPLIAAGPGKFVGVKKNADNTSTYSWRMTNPIPNYEILFNAAPYRIIKDSVKSITGETIPIEFYILPESYDNGA